ncbi:MAG: type III-A CRISPR-associated RAMP protein Csm3 [Actinobacteria bacterium]|nr:type III-A CRISPR-associated RAMP protein Csm3 [Actinomycetota bacterium]
MAGNKKKPFYGKLILSGTVRCETGLHVGASSDIMEIGGLDNPVMRDPFTGYPYIPGSSLKGKLRSIAERIQGKQFNRSIRPGFRHECSERQCAVCRLFGSTAKEKDEENIPSRLRVRDAFLASQSVEWLRGIDTPLSFTELKYENTLDRVTCHADPRPVERIPAGARFSYEIVYDLDDEEQCLEDLENLLNCMAVLEDDYLGGHGSRGYGKIRFLNNRLTLRGKDYYLGKEGEKVLAKEEESLPRLREILGELYERDIKPVFGREG